MEREHNLDRERLFHTIIDLTYDWEYLQGEDEGFIYVSPSCERITGYRPDEFIADPGLLERIVEPEDLPHVQAYFRNVRENRDTSKCADTIEFRVRTRDGAVRVDRSLQPWGTSTLTGRLSVAVLAKSLSVPGTLN